MSTANVTDSMLFDSRRLERVIFWLPIMGGHRRGHLMSKYGYRLTRCVCVCVSIYIEEIENSLEVMVILLSNLKPKSCVFCKFY